MPCMRKTAFSLSSSENPYKTEHKFLRTSILLFKIRTITQKQNFEYFFF